MLRLHSGGGKILSFSSLCVSSPESCGVSSVSCYFYWFSLSSWENSTVVLCRANYTSIFFPCTVQPWHTQTGYYSIFTVWLQCPLLPLHSYCRLESFTGSFFYQYPIEYNFSFCPLCGTLVWVLAHCPKCTLMIFEICNSCQVKYPHKVTSRLDLSCSWSCWCCCFFWVYSVI